MPWHASTAIIFFVTEDLGKKLGQLFFVGFQGYTLSKKTKRFLQTVQPGGIVFFENNIKNKNQVKKLIKDINKCLNIRPFIAVDQEGGSVERLRNICTSLPSVWGLSKLGLKELLTAQKIIVSELCELGLNMNFAPVLDINSNPKNPVIGTRSLHGKPKVVANYGTKIVKLFLRHQIIPVVKHFPGHGDLTVDSHLSLPVLNKSKLELNNFELLPFKEAIKNNAPVVMVGHIQLPKIEKDKKKPASLSKNVIEGLLRKALGFKGLVITDELNMKGVSGNYSLNKASYEAINAGVNMLLFSFNEKSTLATFEYIKKRIKKDKKLQKRIKESYKRIMLAKKRFSSRGALQCASTRTPRRDNEKLAYILADKVVNWIKKSKSFKPLKKTKPIEVIYPITPKLRESDLKTILKERGVKKYYLYKYELNPQRSTINLITRKTNNNRKKVLITYDMAVRNKQVILVKKLLVKDSSLVLISAGLENDIELTPKVKNFIAAYAPNYISLKTTFDKLLI